MSSSILTGRVGEIWCGWANHTPKNDPIVALSATIGSFFGSGQVGGFGCT